MRLLTATAKLALEYPELREHLVPMLRHAREFDTQEALDKYLAEHEGAEADKHWVKKDDDKKPAQDDAEPKDSPEADDEDTTQPTLFAEDRPATPEEIKRWQESASRNEMFDRYKMDIIAGDDDKITVNDLARAEYVADTLVRQIPKGADFCQINPPACEDNRGIRRSSMPQLPEKSVKELLASSKEKDRRKGQAAVDAGASPDSDVSLKKQFLRMLQDEGVYDPEDVTSVRTSELKATQSNMDARKVFGMAQGHLLGEDNPFLKPGEEPFDPAAAEIIISADNYILDGHHRYAAQLITDPTGDMRVKRINMSMDDLLGKAFDMPGVYRMDLGDNVVDPDEPLDLARKPGSTWQQRNGKWYGKTKDGETGGPFEDKDAATAFAKGDKPQAPKVGTLRLAAIHLMNANRGTPLARAVRAQVSRYRVPRSSR
jgi:hypothetical protein